MTNLHLYNGIFKVLFVILLITYSCVAENKSEPPLIKIGTSMPDMTFNNVFYSDQGRFSMKDLRGKPAVLYFFSTACAASFKKLSQIDRMYAKSKSKLILIMVGIDLDDNIQDNYEAYRKKYNLNLPITFDKTIYKQYSIRAVPSVIWINKDRVVQAMTNFLDSSNLEKFIAGQHFDFIDYSPDGKELLRKFNPDKPFLISSSGGVDTAFIQCSLLAEWKNGMPNYLPHAEPSKTPLENLQYLQAIGRELSDLYRLAYFNRTSLWDISDTLAYGNIHYAPILEIKDQSKFHSDYDLGKNLFCYSQILPPERRKPDQMLEVMQRDLKNFFGYEVTIETRQMPYLSLLATESARQNLINKGEPYKFSSDMISLSFSNLPIESLISSISYYNGLALKDLPLIDDTGIKGNINISIQAIMTDFEDVKSALHKQGLEIVQKEKAMKVIVIKEVN